MLADSMASPSNIAQPDYGLAQPVKNLIKLAPVFVAANATVGEAAREMKRSGIGSVLIATEPPGILTDRDLRGRVLAANAGAETPVVRVMSRPLITISSTAPAFAALQLMIDRNIHHLPVGEEGSIIGVISASDLLIHQSRNPLYLRDIIDRLEDVTAIGDYSAAIAALAETLFQGGLAALEISRLVSSLNDALVRRLVHLAEQELGSPPGHYAWIVFGSEGRMEQTLLTDQDNALVFDSTANESGVYFAALSKRVVEGLMQAGFPPCPGGFMATNWTKPIEQWQELFTRWIDLPEPEALLDAAIFFDFRSVAGSLALEPLETIIGAAKSKTRFLAHMLKGALTFRPPLGFFNRLKTRGGKIDLKMTGLAPIVGLARVAAMAEASRQRPTLERLRVAGASGRIIDRESAQALAEIMPFLLHLRLSAQLEAQKNRQPLGNSVAVEQLSPWDRRHLKEALVLVKRMQEDVRAAWRLDATN